MVKELLNPEMYGWKIVICEEMEFFDIGKLRVMKL